MTEFCAPFILRSVKKRTAALLPPDQTRRSFIELGKPMSDARVLTTKHEDDCHRLPGIS